MSEGAHVPDVPGVLLNRSVTGEFPRGGSIFEDHDVPGLDSVNYTRI